MGFAVVALTEAMACVWGMGQAQSRAVTTQTPASLISTPMCKIAQRM